MSQPIEDLINFIIERRNDLGLTQRQLAKAAGLNPGTLANIEVGRVTKAPTLNTLQKLAKGLMVEEIQLLNIARGQTPEAQHRATTSNEMGNPNTHRDEVASTSESTICDEARELGIVFPLVGLPEFWTLSVEIRRPSMSLLKQVIEDTRRIQDIMDRSKNK
jgi:transcriptional regulator with XRE-family HTH domain